MTDEEIERKLWNKAGKATCLLLYLFIIFIFHLMVSRIRRLEDRVFTLERHFPPPIEFKGGE